MIRDARIYLAGLLIIGFVTLIGLAIYADIAEGSQRIVDAGIGALGVALGNAIQGLFRTDKADEQRAANTGAALDTINAALQSSPKDATQ